MLNYLRSLLILFGGLIISLTCSAQLVKGKNAENDFEEKCCATQFNRCKDSLVFVSTKEELKQALLDSIPKIIATGDLAEELGSVIDFHEQIKNTNDNNFDNMGIIANCAISIPTILKAIGYLVEFFHLIKDLIKSGTDITDAWKTFVKNFRKTDFITMENGNVEIIPNYSN